jgi:hypothetical protein
MGLDAGSEERDLERAVDDRSRHANELVKALLRHGSAAPS